MDTKLPYRSPELVVLGDAVSLTEGVKYISNDYLGSGRHGGDSESPDEGAAPGGGGGESETEK